VKKVDTMERKVLSGMVRDLATEAAREYPMSRVRILHAVHPVHGQVSRQQRTAMLLRVWHFVWTQNK
jgi:hypothetical protein